MALGDAILACLTERPMTGYELAKTFDSSIGFFWKADHQQIYRELSRLRDRGHIQGREVVQSGKPNKMVYTLTPEGKAAYDMNVAGLKDGSLLDAARRYCVPDGLPRALAGPSHQTLHQATLRGHVVGGHGRLRAARDTAGRFPRSCWMPCR